MAATVSIPVQLQHDITNRVQRGLLEQFDHTFAISDKALTRTDPGDVRQMSSAFRQLYLALSDLKPFITHESLLNFEISIRSIADALGEICYQDTAILALQEVAPQTPCEITATIHQFIATRKKIRRKSRQALERVLVSLGENVHRAHFANPLPLATRRIGVIRRRKPAGSFRNVADSIVESHLAEFEKWSRLLKEPSPFVELCAMDRATHRLKYAIDLFSDFWTSDVRMFSTSLATLQRALSKVSHYDAWIQELRKQIVQSKKTHPHAAKRTLVFLFAEFSELRNNHLHESFALWNAWESNQLSHKLRKTITRSI